MVKVLKFSVAAVSNIAVAFILVVVGVATNGWVVVNDVNQGISLETSASELMGTEDKPKGQAAYALCIVSTLGASAALVAISVDVVLQVIDKANEKLSPILLLVTLIAAELGGACGIIGSIIHVAWWGRKYADMSYVSNSYHPGYSFFLTVIGSIILIVGGALARKAKKGGQVIGV